MKSIVLVLSLAAALLGQETWSPREMMLLQRIEAMEARIAVLESKPDAVLEPGSLQSNHASRSTDSGDSPMGPAGSTAVSTEMSSETPNLLSARTTINVSLDGYYSYNFNQPFTRTNALRAYDVSGNGFSINQAGIMVEHTPDVERGDRVGGRLDILFGQATETLGGSPNNEQRPDVFRHLFQAYGTYIAPLGKGVAVDFGKWASSFGIEGNYTKDQLNYSRSYWFNFLPYYHTGVRAKYDVTDWLDISYWLTNGLNQTEDSNNFKSHALLLNFHPVSTISANLNYFNGQEQRISEAAGYTALRGRSHFLDSYITWQATDRWTLAAEADYAIERTAPMSAPRVVSGGAGYAAYQVTPMVNLAGRFTYLNDRDAYFSGTGQSLKEATATATFDLAKGFQMRWELRRDWSNTNYFATSNPVQNRRHQTTALAGLVWYFGGKEGSW